VQHTIRLPLALMAFAKSEAEKKHGGSISEYIRNCLEDVKTLYDLPHNQVERIQGDMKQRGIPDMRKYVQYVLSAWAEGLVNAPSKGSKR
jgi:hypothetical protein